MASLASLSVSKALAAKKHLNEDNTNMKDDSMMKITGKVENELESTLLSPNSIDENKGTLSTAIFSFFNFSRVTSDTLSS